MSDNRTRKAFSLIELVIVVVIIGVIAAIAVPRLSRGTAGASDSALSGDLAVLRNAIDLYATEHKGNYPDAAKIEQQLLKYTDLSGTVAVAKDPAAGIIYGPYLRRLPPLPVGAKAGGAKIAAADGDGVGWIYDAATGDIRANCTDAELDASNEKWNEY